MDAVGPGGWSRGGVLEGPWQSGGDLAGGWRLPESHLRAVLTAPWPRRRARYLFLFDKVVIVCKRRGYSYELKEVIELLLHKVTDDPTNNKDLKKVGAPFSGPCPAGAGRNAPGVVGGLGQRVGPSGVRGGPDPVGRGGGGASPGCH